MYPIHLFFFLHASRLYTGRGAGQASSSCVRWTIRCGTFCGLSLCEEYALRASVSVRRPHSLSTACILVHSSSFFFLRAAPLR